MQTTKTSWRRYRALGAWLWIGLALACGESDHESEPKTEDGDDPSTTEAPTPSISVAANDAMTRAPFDATPSPEGKQVYYTALGQADGESVPGVFSVAAAGGEISTLASGEPLVAPVNISVSLDGARLFVADPGANAVFALSSGGGSVSVLAGTSGYTPRGIVVSKQRGEEYAYFTGREPQSQKAGLFRVATAGGDTETVARGELFGDPAGVVVDARGVAYVVDSGADAARARVLRVRDGEVSTFIDGIGVGFPAGITLTSDDSTAIVSGLDPESRRDVVYFVDTGSAKISRLTDTVGQFHEPAGLHRAHNVDVFAWADSQANETGTVYVLKP